MPFLIINSNGKYAGLSRLTFILSWMLLMMNNEVNAQNELDVITNKWIQYSDAPNSLYHYLTGEAFKLLDSRSIQIKQISTKNDLLQRQAKARQTLWEVLGSLPAKTPLNARTINIVEKKDYRIENVIYESLPGFYVTASLFIPKNIKKPAPAILFCSGHSKDVYRLPLYQLPLLNLVKKGFIVLAIDPIGQGERLQYFDKEKGKSAIGGSSDEHSYAASQVFLIGESLARYFVWDGIRSIDYLLSRKEVDPKRIGVHGLSGGGTQAAYISALDERVEASAPAGYITNYRRLLESVGVQDGEQNFYHGISNGLDQADLLEVRAPKPTLIMSTTNDFFSIQGSRETYSEVKRLYELSGKPGNIAITEDDFEHGYTKKNREAMYAFFQKYLQNPGSSSEDTLDFIPAKELQKASTGQVSNSLGGETVFSLNLKEAEKLIAHLDSVRKDTYNHLLEAVKSAKILSGYHDPSMVNDPVFTGRIQREGYSIEKYFVKGEGDYVIPYLLLIPSKPGNKALIYLHPQGKSTEAKPGGEMEWFVKNGFTVLAPDLIGIGETGPGISTAATDPDNVSYTLWYTSILINRSIVGIRAGDVVRLCSLLKNNHAAKEVYAVARKEMTQVLLHAAAFDKEITRVALIDSYSSYKSILRNRFYDAKLVQSMVAGALQSYDLPDLAASLAPGNLFMIGIGNGNQNSPGIDKIESEQIIIKDTYRSLNSENKLNIVSFKSNEDLLECFKQWIK